MEIRRIFVEKKAGFDIPAKRILGDIREVLKINCENLRVFLRYDISGIEEADFEFAVNNVFCEPPATPYIMRNSPNLADMAFSG